MKTVTLLSLRLTITKKVTQAGVITVRTSQSMFMAAEVSTETLEAGITHGLIMASTVLNGAGDGEVPGDGVMPGDGAILTGATDGDLVVSTTHGIAPIMEDGMEFIIDLSMVMGLHPITIEAEVIQVLVLDDLNTIETDLASPTEVVILGQKLAADRAELVQTIDIVMQEVELRLEMCDLAAAG